MAKERQVQVQVQVEVEVEASTEPIAQFPAPRSVHRLREEVRRRAQAFGVEARTSRGPR